MGSGGGDIVASESTLGLRRVASARSGPVERRQDGRADSMHLPHEQEASNNQAGLKHDAGS